MPKLPTFISRTAPLAAVAFALAVPAAASASPGFTPATTLDKFGSPSFGYANGEETSVHFEIDSVSPFESRVVVATRRPGGPFTDQLVVPTAGGDAPLSPKLAVSQTGAAVAAWLEFSTDQNDPHSRIEASYRNTAGDWEQPVTVAADSESGTPDVVVAIGADGTAVAVGTHNEADSPGEQHPDKRVDAIVHEPSGGWDSPTRLSAPDIDSQGVDAGVDAAGNIDVTYQQRYVEGPNAKTSAVLRRRSASNGVWATAENLTPPQPPTNATAPTLDVAPDGRAVIALQSEENGAFQVQGAVRESASAGFGPLTDLDPGAHESAPQAAAIGPDGAAYVLYSADDNAADGDHAGLVRATPGAGFSGPHRVSSQKTRANSGGIAFSGDDAVVAWDAKTGDGSTIQATRWAAGSPAAEAFHDLDAPAAATAFENVASDGEGGVAITWSLNAVTELHGKQAAFDGGPPADGDASVPATAVAGQAVPMKASFTDRWSALAAGPDWKFGDGAEAAGGEVSHAYAAPGDYTVTVRSADVLGNARERSFPVHVTAAPSAPAATPAPKVKLKAPKCSPRLSAKACKRFLVRRSTWKLLHGTAKDVARVQVTVKRRGAKARVVKASLKGGKWTAKVKPLKAGVTTFTVRGFASDGSASAPVAKKVRLR